MTKTLNGKQWKSMAASGAAMLDRNKETLNALNIFPVPDGDTGTNMGMTAAAAAREVAQIGDPDPDLRKILTAMSAGALRGARGNSGVILSQLMAGFVSALQNDGQDGYDVEAFVQGIEKGTELAYNAVMRPKEGTILTVAADVAKAARTYADKYDDFEGLLAYINKKGNESLSRTQEMLPVLKEAGVVDAGGAGLMAVLSGFQAAVEGRELDASELLAAEKPKTFTDVGACDREIEFGYCTEFFVRHMYPQIRTRDINKFREKLSTIGDCVIVVGDTDLLKVHVHTNTPGTALNSALQLGELSSVKIDNMREQHRELDDGAASDKPEAEVAVTAIANGEGFTAVFEDCQVKSFVNGGQSLNPSADEIARAIRATRAKHVIVLPNNKNIVLAAEQAAKLVDQDVTVIKTTTLPEGVAAAIAYDPEASAETNVEKMRAASEAVWSGQVTHAVRDALFKGAEVRKGEVIGLHDGKIVSSGHRFESVVAKLLADIPEETELVTIYHGSDVTPEDAERVRAEAAKEHPDIDIDLLYGGQPVYDYIVSAE
ncbi:MAG: DAK2 domain-containing protein [Clostridia bacterium]|nr:DAK2 domain-containing protein [Clostridia bacterium]